MIKEWKIAVTRHHPSCNYPNKAINWCSGTVRELLLAKIGSSQVLDHELKKHAFMPKSRHVKLPVCYIDLYR